MIKQPETLSVKHNINMRGGDGTVVLRELLNPDAGEFYGKGRLFSHITINPGCSVGFHKHEGELEAYYVLSGQGIFNDNGAESAVGPGAVLLTLDGESHGLACAGDAPLEVIALILFK